MKKLTLLGIVFLLHAWSADGGALAKQLGITPGSKAIKQWEKVFADDEKKAKMGISKLSPADQWALKTFLIKHAADSDSPAVAGF